VMVGINYLEIKSVKILNLQTNSARRVKNPLLSSTKPTTTPKIHMFDHFATFIAMVDLENCQFSTAWVSPFELLAIIYIYI
jgi:hypothetical protein